MEAEEGKSLLYRLLYMTVGYFTDGGGKTNQRKKQLKPPQTPVSPNLDFIALHSKDIISNLEIPVFKAAVVSEAPKF